VRPATGGAVTALRAELESRDRKIARLGTQLAELREQLQGAVEANQQNQSSLEALEQKRLSRDREQASTTARLAAAAEGPVQRRPAANAHDTEHSVGGGMTERGERETAARRTVAVTLALMAYRNSRVQLRDAVDGLSELGRALRQLSRRQDEDGSEAKAEHLVHRAQNLQATACLHAATQSLHVLEEMILELESDAEAAKDRSLSDAPAQVGRKRSQSDAGSERRRSDAGSERRRSRIEATTGTLEPRRRSSAGMERPLSDARSAGRHTADDDSAERTNAARQMQQIVDECKAQATQAVAEAQRAHAMRRALESRLEASACAVAVLRREIGEMEAALSQPREIAATHPVDKHTADDERSSLAQERALEERRRVSLSTACPSCDALR